MLTGSLAFIPNSAGFNSGFANNKAGVHATHLHALVSNLCERSGFNNVVFIRDTIYDTIEWCFECRNNLSNKGVFFEFILKVIIRNRVIRTKFFKNH